MSFDFLVLSFFPCTSPPWDSGWVRGNFEVRNSKFEIENGVKTSQESQWSG